MLLMTPAKFSVWDTTKEKINLFISKARKHHLRIKFTAEISEKEIHFLDTTMFKGEDSTRVQSLTFTRISNLQRNFNIYSFFFLSRPRRT